MKVGDYALSFSEETLELRQPLSNVFKRLWSVQPEPVSNGYNFNCSNKIANTFIAEIHPQFLFLRLPKAHNQNEPRRSARGAKNG